MPEENAPDGANLVPADPNSASKNSDPSNSDKKSDMQRVVESKERYKAELEEERKKREELEAKVKAQEEAELEKQGKLAELAEQRKLDLDAAKAREAELQKQIDEQNDAIETINQEREARLQEQLAAIPEDKRPPISDNMPIAQREQMVQYAASLVQSTTKSGGFPPAGNNPSHQARLAELKAKPNKTREEKMELIELSAKE